MISYDYYVVISTWATKSYYLICVSKKSFRVYQLTFSMI